MPSQLTPYFDAIIGDGDGHPRKPDPAAVRALIARFGTTAARTLMVGDGLPDMAVAPGRALRGRGGAVGVHPGRRCCGRSGRQFAR